MAPRLDPAGVARALREMARLLDLAGESPFKVRAYDRAAHAIERSGREVARLLEEGRLTQLRGIGPRLAITELHQTGTCRALETLRREYPPGAAELSRIPELGLKRIKAVSAAFGIETIAQLKDACEAGRLRGIKGIGEKTEHRILERMRIPSATTATCSMAWPWPAVAGCAAARF
jgi:DNA polymerase (family X)